MIKLTPFKKEHYQEIIGDSDQGHLTNHVNEADLIAVEQNPYSVSCFYGEKLLGVGGIILAEESRGEAWGVVAPGIRTHFHSLHREVKKYLGRARLRRIEAVVHCDYPAGHRWVKALGFSLEAECMKAYTLDGKDASLYSIVKGGA